MLKEMQGNMISNCYLLVPFCCLLEKHSRNHTNGIIEQESRYLSRAITLSEIFCAFLLWSSLCLEWKDIFKLIFPVFLKWIFIYRIFPFWQRASVGFLFLSFDSFNKHAIASWRSLICNGISQGWMNLWMNL